jgi:hypothetical protein
MAVLIGMSGRLKGQRFELEADEVLAGRSPDNAVCLEDPSVSGRHCSIRREGNRYTLNDLGSTNGTRLNGIAVTSTRLKPKDIVQIGTVELMFDGEEVETAPLPETPTTRIEAIAGPAEIPGTFRTASPFGARRDSRSVWVIVTVVLILAVLGALVFFLMRMSAV